MKQKIFFLAAAAMLLLSFNSKAQDADKDETIVNEAGLTTINGTLTLNGDAINLASTDCIYQSNGSYTLTESKDNEKLIKKWKKNLSKNNNTITEVTVKGILSVSNGKATFEPKGISEAQKRPSKLSGAPKNDLYVTTCFDDLDKVKAISKSCSYLTVESKEVNGMTNLTYYDENCKQIDVAAAAKRKNETLKIYGKAILDATTLLAATANLNQLLNDANAEKVPLTAKITATTNTAIGIKVQGLILKELPIMIAKMKKSNDLIQNLKAE